MIKIYSGHDIWIFMKDELWASCVTLKSKASGELIYVQSFHR